MNIKTQFRILLIFLFCSLIVEAQDIDTLIDLGTHKMHFTIWEGEGTPILFEAGGGNDGSIWLPIAEQIHSITGTTIITYDRSGYGKSEINESLPDDQNGLIHHGISNLEKGLEQLGFDEDIIMVVHSFGGLYAAYYAAKYPDKVKGIVMIDASLGCFYTDEYLEELRAERTEEWLANIKSLSLPLYYECLSQFETVEIMKEVIVPTSIPIISLVAETPPFSQRSNESWIACHKDFANESENRTFILAYDCEHYLHYDNPQIAIDAITKMYCQIGENADYKNILERSLSNSIQNTNEYRQKEFDYWHSERETNNWAYNNLSKDEKDIALKIFELNTLLYSDAFNVWDSYGEMLLSIGEKEKAIIMYEKSLALNPDNENAKMVLERIKQ